MPPTRAEMPSGNSSTLENYTHKAIALSLNDSFVLADLGTWMGYAWQLESGKAWVTRASLSAQAGRRRN